ncbi:YitT family protein [Microbacterium sp. ZXX196]|uniref:YitT family protein n=1 Tax=Microbacterium sp. ZXX196 TaxID=2609291 RepID=UPI0012B77E44|nr:YitT family protein [Microbacterium sp. ZXX196]MTE24491.1 YitT family protein [Microbacterium sp. ZXX196]
MTAAIPVPRPATKHSVGDDILGILCGTVVVSLGLFLLRAGGDVSGGTAGLALLLSYATPVPFGVFFFAINVPFFLLAIRSKGWGFVLRSVLAIALVSAASAFHGSAGALGALALDPFYAAVAGSTLAGVGVLIFFRHGASMGGFNILGLVLQERFHLRAGYVMMTLDTIVVLSAFAVASWPVVVASGLGAVIMNLIIAFNHRPGRYVASS